MKLLLLIPCAAVLSAGEWKIHIDKKTSQITGSQNARAQMKAKRGGAYLVLGCHDAKPFLRIAENFKLENTLNDAFTKSRLERAIDKTQRFGFAFTIRDGLYYSRVKLRLGGKQEYLDTETLAGYNRGTYILMLDDRRAELLPGMRTDSLLYAQLPYKDGDKVVEFSLEGLDSALARLEMVGCVL